MKKDISASIKSYFDLVIVGGGLAGLTSAIHLSKHPISVLVIEKNSYPVHKVCGEYISNEVLPYLMFLGIDPFQFGAKEINKFELSTSKSRVLKCDLPLGGFGISRHKIDHVLFKKARSNGVVILQDMVTNIEFFEDEFIINTTKESIFRSEFVIGAYGKRSAIDVKLDRNFIKKKSPYLAVKTHVKVDFPDDLVAIHNFKGGYCGASKVEDGSVNLCYITDFKAFKKYKNINEFQKQVVFNNKYLKSIFENSKSVFESPLTISQISFLPKYPVEKHIIMCGDTAGLIHPLCGNGMSMAIRSAQIASQLIIKYYKGEIQSRKALEKVYSKEWDKAFKSRLYFGQFISSIFRRNQLSEALLMIIKLFPIFLPLIIKYTHGKPMEAK